jgi:hypothetical protein
MGDACSTDGRDEKLLCPPGNGIRLHCGDNLRSLHKSVIPVL